MGKITPRLKSLLLVSSLLIFGFPFLMASDEEAYVINITGTITHVSCYGGSDAAIKISVTGVDGSYSVNWSGPNTYSSSSEDISGLKAGTYTVTVEDGENSENKSFTVNQPTELLINSIQKTPVSCNGGTDGSITAGNVTGGTSGFEYRLDNGTWQSSNSFTGLSAKNYILYVKDSKGCETSVEVEVTQPDPLQMQAATTEPVSCNGESDGSITAGNVTGGNSGYEYRLDYGTWQSSNSFTGLSAKNYILYVKDSKGCETSVEVEVTQPDPLQMQTATPQSVSCHGESDGSITAGNVTGGNSDYKYRLDNGAWQSSNSFTGLSAKNHTLYVKDSKGCETSVNVEITQPDVLNASVSHTDVTCFDANDGTISISNPTGGFGQYEFSIDNGTTWQVGGEFTNLPNATYQVIIRDADNTGCEISLNNNLEITQPIILAAEITSTDVTCNGSQDATLKIINPSGGHGQYQYSINGGTSWQNSGDYSNLSNGSYNVQIRDRDENGCVIILDASFEITQPEDLSAGQSTITDVTCFDESDGKIEAGTVSGGTGPFQYSIDNINWQDTGVFNGLKAKDYTIFIKDQNSCAIQIPVTVDEPDELFAEIEKKDISCFAAKNGEIYLNELSGGSGQYDFTVDGITWVDGNQKIIIEEPGDYQVQLRDKNQESCKKSLGTVSISEPSKLEVEITKTNTTEYGTPTGTATANVTGGIPGYSYKWEKLEGESWNILSQQTRTINNLTAGDYRLIVTDQNNCTTETEGEPNPYEFTIIDKITANISIFSSCNDSDNDIRVSEFTVMPESVFGGLGTEASYQYEWEFGSNAITGDIQVIRTPGGNPVNTTAPFTGDSDDVFIVSYNSIGAQTITLTVIDSNTQPPTEDSITFPHLVNGCFTECGNANDVDSSVEDFFIGRKLSNGNYEEVVNCDESSGPLYLIAKFKASKTTKLSVELEYTITPPDGTPEVYSVDIVHEVDLNKIDYFPIFEIGIGEDDIRWNCGDDFEILFASFDWDKPGNGNSGQPHCLGINVQVPVSTPLKATAVPTHIDCFDYETGTIAVSVSGGSGNYSLEAVHSSGEIFVPTTNTTKFNNLPAGEYTVTVSDGKYDDIILNLEILQPDQITATVIPTDPVCYSELGSAMIDPEKITGGTPPFTYEWNDTALSTTPAVDLLPGTYTVTIRDSNNCSITLSAQINQPEKVTQPETGPDVELQCGSNNVSLEGNSPDSSIGEIGTWRVISGQPVGNYGFGETNSETSNEPNAVFSATAGEYDLVWEISNTNQATKCAKTSDPIKIIFKDPCTTLNFDGVDDHIVSGDHLGFTTGSFTMEAWVKPHSVTGTQTVFSKRNSKNLGQGGFDFVINSGTPTFRWGSRSLSSSSIITENRWYHIAVIYQNGEARLFVDGIRIAITTTATNPTSIATPFIIGGMHNSDNPDVPVNYFHGWIEEARLWKKALSQDQLRFLMNQRLEPGTSPVKGTTLPMAVPGTLNFTDLEAYYPLLATEATDGITKDLSNNGLDGQLRNIITPQENTAPLPYVAAKAGDWWNTNTWQEPLVWDPPSSPGITGDTIAWNIVRLNNKLVHNPASTNNSKSIDLLALLDEGGTLDMQGANNTSGNGILITHYLKLDGVLDLNGESQLIQSEGSEVVGSGHIERDQQGTASSHNYNYWSSPVLPSNKSTYTVKSVMFDGTDLGTNQFKIINFGDRYAHADEPLASPIKISNFWINAFRKKVANQYSQWERIGSDPADAADHLKPGEGYTMKGTYWVSVKKNKLQNYTFKGFPNNGDIELPGISQDQNYLIGNPYPSAVNAIKFIEGHLKNSNSSLSGNVFNGTIYYWDHYSGQTHYLEEYVGGYAAFNLSGGIRALSNDDRINFEAEDEGTKTPGPYIPVGQGFFINTASGDADAQTNTGITGGTIKFKNEYRVFASEKNTSQSLFLSPESLSKQKASSAQDNKMRKDTRYKIRLQFNSPTGYIREVLVTADRKSTNEYDLGYDAPLLDNSSEDMYWMINNNEFLIQAVPHFNIDQVLPLGLKIAEESEFSIKIKELENIPEGFNIYLKDKSDDSYFDLAKADFKASLSPETYNDRYEIVFYNGEEPEEEPLVDENSELVMGYSYNSRELHLQNPEMLEINKLVIYSISGQEVHSFLEVPKAKLITLELDKPLSSAVYVVRAYTNKGEIATQVIIKQ